MAQQVRELVYTQLRERGMTTIFANPGSTEVAFLAAMPGDFDFVLGLHEATVVGMATGYAIGRERAAFVLLHTTAGLGNAVGAIATARVNRAPMVIVVGQQDRRHLALEPFLAGRLEGLAGDYPLEVITPAHAGDVPSAIERAGFVAEQQAGPVLVIVPMDDWEAETEPSAAASARRVQLGRRSVPEGVAEIAEALHAAASPAIIAGAGNDTEDGWRTLTALAETLDAPVWIEPFGARAGFPQDHRLYQGQVPAERSRVRGTFDGSDAIVIVGTAALRQYPFADGPLFPPGARLFVLTDDPAEAGRSPVELALVGDIPAMVGELTGRLPARDSRRSAPPSPADAFRLPPAGPGEPLRPAHVFEILARHLPEDTILLEESPSSRPALQAMVPARRPLGFVSAAMGGLGFAMPAAVGLKMARADRPVVVVIGDGSSLYSIQSLWSAGERAAGVLFVVLANGGYAVMDRLAEQRGAQSAWPSFPEVSVATMARGYGIEALRIDDVGELQVQLARACETLAQRTSPLLLEIAVRADEDFAP